MAEDPRAFITDDVRRALKSPTFDMWSFTEEQIVYLICEMFSELGFVDRFKLDPVTLLAFARALQKNYNDTPFHNFYHCFCVTQMVFCELLALRPRETMLSEFEKFTVLVSATCHDLDHGGLNNNYQVNARTPLAMVYNDVSVLENHHCSQGFAILSQPETNLIKNFTVDEYKQFRRIMIKCILATDMASHFRIKGLFAKLIPNGEFSFAEEEHRELLCQILLMCADISNEVRPWGVSKLWAERLVEEFGNQVLLEKAKGLPFMAFMDKELVVIEKSQAGFISGVLRPLWATASELLPELKPFVDLIDLNYKGYCNKIMANEAETILDDCAESKPTEKAFAAGATIFKNDDPSGEVYFLQSGEAEVVGNDGSVLDTLPSPCFFGEGGALYQKPNGYSVRAKADSKAQAVAGAELVKIAKANPEYLKSLETLAKMRDTVFVAWRRTA